MKKIHKNSHNKVETQNSEIDDEVLTEIDGSLSLNHVPPLEITLNQSKTMYSSTTKQSPHILKIEDAELPTNFEGNYYPLPSIVDFKRIISNIINALRLSEDNEHKNRKNESSEKIVKIREEKLEKWKKFLEIDENKAIVSDAFWYAICKFFYKKKMEKITEAEEIKNHEEEEEINKFKFFIEENLLNRMSRNYVNFLLSIEDKFEKDDFFKVSVKKINNKNIF